MRVSVPVIKYLFRLHRRGIGIALSLCAMLLWSTVPVGTKLLMSDGAFSVSFISAARLALAAVVFLCVYLLNGRKIERPVCASWKARWWLVAAAVAICVNYFIYAFGLRFTTAGATSIISQINSAATVLLAAWLLHERLTAQKVAGMLIAMAGVIFVVARVGAPADLLMSGHLLGNILQVIAALAWPFYAIGQSKAAIENPGRPVLLPIFVLAALLSAAILPFSGPMILHTPTQADWAILIFLGVGSTAAAYWFFAAGLQRIETSEGTMINVLMPPIALLLAHWLLGEPLSRQLVIGLIFVISGLTLIVWRRDYSPVRAISRVT